MSDLKKLFNPQSVAIVGATEKDGKVGNVIAKNILKLGFAGEVFLVNPKHQELFGKKCYKSLSDIEGNIDLAIIVVPAKFVNQIVKNSGEKIKNFVIISAGFSEIGTTGKKRERKLLEISQKNNLNILGPNCLGFIAPKINLNASFAGGMPEEGGVSFISQSGALAVAILDLAKKEQIKFSQIISVGNKMQLSETKLIEYFSEDEQTKVIAIYAEGIKNGRKFMEVAQKVSAKKPIVILKAGRSEQAQKAIASHTGSLAGSDKVMDVAFKKAGIIRADNLAEFFALIKFISNFKKFNNPNTVIVTNAGGPGVLATDNFQNKAVLLAKISQEAKNALNEFLPEEASSENPIDLLGDADEARYQKTLEILQKEKVGNILCLMTAQDQTPTEKIAKVIAEFSQQTTQNIIPVFIGGKKIKKALKILQKNNIPNFNFPKEIIDVLDKIVVNEKNGRRKMEGGDDLAKALDKRRRKVRKIIQKAQQENRKALLFKEAENVMQEYGIPVVKFASVKAKRKFLWQKFQKDRVVYGGEFPAVLKVDSDKILHKTDKQGLILGIKNQEELTKAIQKMRTNFSQENLIIQPMLKYKAELILGLKRDATFGPVLVFGLGGIYTEIFKMVDFLLLPLTREEIKTNILESKIGFLFKKTRGKKIADIEDIMEILFNFAQLANEQEDIREIDINPLLIDERGKLVAVDVKIII